ncbi:collagen alpha-1(XV) chain-like [Palaemon carinicauda]|uniref:collagen alpha-1(XV) chain-like n=1 Tax=Palaemon carinicauda TaxID=392227 RepID=UPI0035B5AD47
MESSQWRLFIKMAPSLAMLLSLALCAQTSSASSLFGDSNTVSSSESLEELDLMQSIDVPFSDPLTQYFVTGFDGFPAFGFRLGANIKQPYRLFLPERLFRVFSKQGRGQLSPSKPETTESQAMAADNSAGKPIGSSKPPNLSSCWRLQTLLETIGS